MYGPKFVMHDFENTFELAGDLLIRPDGELYAHVVGDEIISPTGDHLGFMSHEEEEVQWDDGTFDLEY